MLDKKYAVFTMDVEPFTDTECVAKLGEHVAVDLLDGFDEYIKMLEKHNIKSTLFTVGSLIPSMTDKLKDCINNGHEIALHNYEHVAPIDTPLDEFKTKLLKTKNELSELLDVELIGFRAPCFGIDTERILALKEMGFKYDSSFLGYKARHTVRLDFKNFTNISKNIFNCDDFFEFGLQKQKFLGISFPISGGAYTRLGDWYAIKRLIKKYIKENDFYVFYVHPFELTKKKIPILKNLKLYDKIYLRRGIKRNKKHIEQIINMLKKQGYTFLTFDQLTTKLNTATN